MSDLCKYMEKALAEEYERSKDRLIKRLEIVERKKNAAEGEMGELRALQRELYDKAGCSDLSHGRILDQVRSLQEQRRQMKMDLAVIAARSEAVGQSSSSQAGGKNELAQLAIRSAETQAKLGFVNDQLEEIKEKKLLELADRMEQEVISKLDVANKVCERASDEARHLRAKLSGLQVPEVTIIGGK